MLKEDGREILMKALSSIEAAAGSLKDGVIECEIVGVLRDNSDRFLVLCDHIYREQSKIDFLRQSLNRRCIELDAFDQEGDDVRAFVRMCSTLKQGNNHVNLPSMRSVGVPVEFFAGTFYKLKKPKWTKPIFSWVGFTINLRVVN